MGFLQGLLGKKMKADKSPQERRAASLARLRAEGIPYIESLPVIETAQNVKLRETTEIARRAIACLLMIQVAFEIQNGSYSEEIRAWAVENLEAYDVLSAITPKESKVLENQAGDQDLVDMIWTYEAYWVLTWALGLIEKLDFPSQICDCARAIELVRQTSDLEDFLSRCQPRSVEEILDQDDLVYRYHWACVDARLKGEEPPAALIESIVVERRRGLDWLLGLETAQDWDQVQMHT